MSLLRDGVHRRALLTARSGVARSGASRLGWCPGQNDLDGNTREIKSNPGLTGVGPRYLWTERYKNATPFSGIVAYPVHVGLGRLLLTALATHNFIRPAHLLLGATATHSLVRTATPAHLLLGGSGLGSTFSSAHMSFMGFDGSHN